MKTKPTLLLLENHSYEWDTDSWFKKYTAEAKTTTDEFDVEVWDYFSDSYWPENRQATVERLLKHTNFICHHVFVDWMQLEIFIEILSLFKEKGIVVNMWIYTGLLMDHFKEWYEEYEADTTPNTKEYNDNPKLRDEFKENLNKKFLELLDYHNIYNTDDDYELRKCSIIRSKDILEK